jgi:hypothetical protein
MSEIHFRVENFIHELIIPVNNKRLGDQKTISLKGLAND